MSDEIPRERPDDEPEAQAPTWFRSPDAREHRIAGWLFVAFGAFFVTLFVLHVGWWFRWVVLGLGVYSIMRGVGHLRDARRIRRHRP